MKNTDEYVNSLLVHSMESDLQNFILGRVNRLAHGIRARRIFLTSSKNALLYNPLN